MIKALFDWLFGKEVDHEGFEKRVRIASEFPHLHYFLDGQQTEIIYQDILMKSGC